MTTQQQTADVFELVSPPLYRLVLGEPPFVRARDADDTIDAVGAMNGRLPAADLLLAALHKYAMLARDPALAAFVAALDEVTVR